LQIQIVVLFGMWGVTLFWYVQGGMFEGAIVRFSVMLFASPFLATRMLAFILGPIYVYALNRQNTRGMRRGTKALAISSIPLMVVPCLASIGFCRQARRERCLLEHARGGVVTAKMLVAGAISLM
jgi:hypothetical protein